jgi:hypothetical protein
MLERIASAARHKSASKPRFAAPFDRVLLFAMLLSCPMGGLAAINVYCEAAAFYRIWHLPAKPGTI